MTQGYIWISVCFLRFICGPHFLRWISGVVPFNMWLIPSREENKCCFKLSNDKHVEWNRLHFVYIFAQLLTIVIFFSACDKSRVKWELQKFNTESEDPCDIHLPKWWVDLSSNSKVTVNFFLKYSFLRRLQKFMQSALWFRCLLSKCQNLKAECANFCGLLRKAKLYIKKKSTITHKLELSSWVDKYYSAWEQNLPIFVIK